MKIIQILPQLKEGGVERGTLDLCFYLKNQGHEVWVISHGGPLVRTLEEKGISHLSWPVHKKNPLTIFRMSQRLRHLIQKEKIDIVHARSRVPAWITYFACHKIKTKWVTTCHGYYRAHFGSRAMGWADKIIVATQIIKTHMTQDFNVPQEKITLIPRGVDLDTFTFIPPSPPMTPTIGMIGRLTPLKGHKDFLEALALLKKQNKSFKTKIIGEAKDPFYLKELLDLTQKLGLSQNVEFLGHQENIPNFLKQMHLLVLPTTYPEAFGRVIIEAQAVGVPVVATRVGGIQEVIDDGQTGILCTPHHPLDLAKAMTKILENPSLAQALVQKARKKVEAQYSKEQMVQKTEHLYLEMLQPHILVIKLTSLGDVILISASLRALKQKFPDSIITLLTDPLSREVVEHCPYIDKIIYVSKKNLRHAFWDLVSQIKNSKFDISIDFQNTFWTHLLSFLSRIPRRYGYGRKWGWLFLSHTAPHTSLPAVEHQFEILKLLGIPPHHLKLEFWITDKDRESLHQKSQTKKYDLQKPFSIIHLGASWATKRWTSTHIAQFCEYLSQKEHLTIIFTGLEKDLEFEREIRAQTKVSPLSLVGKLSLRELGALIEKCESFISPDSAPLHIAAALGKPTLAFFGPTDAHRHRPPTDKLLILQEKVDCGPCYKPTCGHHSCMVRLTPSHAIEAYKNLQRL